MSASIASREAEGTPADQRPPTIVVEKNGRSFLSETIDRAKDLFRDQFPSIAGFSEVLSDKFLKMAVGTPSDSLISTWFARSSGVWEATSPDGLTVQELGGEFRVVTRGKGLLALPSQVEPKRFVMLPTDVELRLPKPTAADGSYRIYHSVGDRLVDDLLSSRWRSTCAHRPPRRSATEPPSLARRPTGSWSDEHADNPSRRRLFVSSVSRRLDSEEQSRRITHAPHEPQQALSFQPKPGEADL